MNATVRRLLAATAITGLAASLAACGPGASEKSDATVAAMTPLAPQPGWSMQDLANADPSSVDSAAPLPRALPMQASASTGYHEAPSADYSNSAPVAYVPTAAPEDYQPLGMASALTGMLGSAPPDYGFAYQGVRPWAWETGDHYLRYAEPVSGGYRYYYYQPNSARPFLISDPYYSYGYRGDHLVNIYDRSGRLIDARNAIRERQAAQNYYARAAEMYAAAHREQRYGVSASLWQRHRDEVARQQRQWDDARRQQQQWQRWQAANDQRLKRDWASEAVVRRQAETSFAGWQQADFRTPAPRLYTDQQRRADLRKIADMRRQQEAQRVQLAQRTADQRAAQLRQQAEAQKLAQQRRALALQQQHQQDAARDQRAEQARLQAQHQAQVAEADRIAKQKAAVAQVKQAADRKAQLAKAEQQKAQQAKAAAERQAANAAERKRKADQARLAAEQKAKQALAAERAAEQKAKQQAAARQAAEQKAKHALAAKQAAKDRLAKAHSKKAQADEAAAADKKHGNGQG